MSVAINNIGASQTETRRGLADTSSRRVFFCTNMPKDHYAAKKARDKVRKNGGYKISKSFGRCRSVDKGLATYTAPDEAVHSPTEDLLGEKFFHNVKRTKEQSDIFWKDWIANNQKRLKR